VYIKAAWRPDALRSSETRPTSPSGEQQAYLHALDLETQIFVLALAYTYTLYTTYLPAIMRLFLTAALVAWAGAAAALPALTVPVLAPQVNEVKIINITAIGSGCPAGHAVINIDATGTIFDIAFDQYTASVGPGNLPADARKNCRVSINLQFPAGFQ